MAEENKNPEPMQIAKPEQPQVQNQPPAADEMAQIVTMLDGLGVKTPKDVEAMAISSKQAGRLANMVGELKAQNQQLLSQVQQIQNQPKQPDPYAYNPAPSNQGLDIQELIKNAVRSVYQDDIIKPQQEAQNRYTQQMNRIRGDRYWEQVKDIFTARINDPEIQYDLQTGANTIDRLFDNTKMEFLETTMQKLATGWKGILDKGAKPSGSEIPHMEQGRQSGNYLPPNINPDTREKLKERSKQSRGTDSDLDDLINIVMSGGQPPR